jgi:putative membrane protein
MTEPPGTTSTLPLPPPAATGSSPPPPPPAPAPSPPRTGRMHTRFSGIRTGLIAAVAGLIVVMIFIIQNAHPANISFLGVHLVLPLAGALLLAAIAGSLLTITAGPVRITRLQQIMRRGLHKTRTDIWARYDRRPQGPERTPSSGLEAPAAFFRGDQPGDTTVYASHVTD